MPFIIAQNAPLEVLAVGMTFSMISANIDLSPGSMLSLAAMVTGLVIESTGSLWWAMLAALALTLCVGAVTGALVGRLQISAIIVTLATYIWAAGLATAINGANAIPMKRRLVQRTSTTASTAGRGRYWWCSSSSSWASCCSESTKFGYYARAIGGSSEFARRSGVPVVPLRGLRLRFHGAGHLGGHRPVLGPVGRGSIAQPGSGLELDAIVAVVIGGTRLTGGEGSVLRSGLGGCGPGRPEQRPV